MLAGGVTLVHEHLSQSRPFPFRQPANMRVSSSDAARPHIWGPTGSDVAVLTREVEAAHKDGVTCIVDAGTRDLGRNIENLRQIARQVSGVHIVAGGGLWTQVAYPPDIATKTDEQVAEDFFREATAERWGMIGEIGSSLPMHPDERKVLRAAARLHIRTGLPLMTHTPHAGCGPCALEQLAILESAGVDMRKMCIGHLSDIMDDPRAETHKAVAKRGAFVGLDTAAIRSEKIPQQVVVLLALLEAGYEDQVLLSSDLDPDGQYQQMKQAGGPGFARSLTVFVPRLREAGVKESTIHKMTVDNPRRFLAFVPRPAA